MVTLYKQIVSGGISAQAGIKPAAKNVERRLG